MAKVRQVGALCWRKRRGKIEVLLVTSRESKRWVIPKGWPMPGLKDYNAARREAFEEAGVAGRMKRMPLGSFVYNKRRPDGMLPVSVAVFALAVTREYRSWLEKKSRARVWLAPSEAARLVDEARLRRLILAFDA